MNEHVEFTVKVRSTFCTRIVAVDYKRSNAWHSYIALLTVHAILNSSIDFSHLLITYNIHSLALYLMNFAHA